MNIILLAIIAILLLIKLVVDSKFVVRDYKKEKETEEKRLNSEAAKILLSGNYVEQINGLIDSMIREQVDIYQILVLSTENDLHYIKSEDQEKLHKFVTYKVVDNISPEVRELIGLVYNVSNDKELESVISTRAKMYLIGFILDYNKETENF